VAQAVESEVSGIAEAAAISAQCLTVGRLPAPTLIKIIPIFTRNANTVVVVIAVGVECGALTGGELGSVGAGGAVVFGEGGAVGVPNKALVFGELIVIVAVAIRTSVGGQCEAGELFIVSVAITLVKVVVACTCRTDTGIETRAIGISRFAPTVSEHIVGIAESADAIG
jgi:hypothetical protein